MIEPAGVVSILTGSEEPVLLEAPSSVIEGLEVSILTGSEEPVLHVAPPLVTLNVKVSILTGSEEPVLRSISEANAGATVPQKPEWRQTSRVRF